MRPTCETCRHFNALGPDCHRQPPVVFVVVNPMGRQQFISGWPPVRAGIDWCAEHEATAAAKLGLPDPPVVAS